MTANPVPAQTAVQAPTWRVDGPHDTWLWHAADGGLPVLLHWGRRWPAGEHGQELAGLAELLEAPLPHGGLDVPERVSWLPEPGLGFTGAPGLELRRGERRLYTQLRLQSLRPVDGGWALDAVDEHAGVRLDLHWRIDAATGVATAGCCLHNLGPTPLAVDHLASLTLALPPQAEERIGLGGHWGAEFQLQRAPLGPGDWMHEARTGRSSHHAHPFVALVQRGTDGCTGQAWSAQIAWPGNHFVRVQHQRLGGAQWQIGERLLPGECVLEPGESHTTPVVHLAYSPGGLHALAARWQQFVRQQILPDGAPPRVALNSWEATYFDHQPGRMLGLVDAAAALGVERFVLDDGWMPGRRHDRSGLGDWQPCPQRYPEGLRPLALHCQARGLQFALWVEPEGVNADSALYRAHPEWTLQADGLAQPLGRQQYVLDFGRTEVRAWVLEQLSGLLRSAPIGALKWDMNRDFTHEAGADGRSGVHRHVQGLLAVLAELRARFPAVEIEACASGGGRADLGLMAHARRLWLSDCNDPLERASMLAAASLFLPPEVLGVHVGPAHSHTTGRPTALATRTLLAFFGHFGLELDPVELTDDERAHLQQAIAAYQACRDAREGATLLALDSPDPALIALWLLAADRRRGWLGLIARGRSATALPGLLTLPGLRAECRYVVAAHPLWPAPAPGAKRGGLLDRGGEATVSGQALDTAGLRLPMLWPGQGCLLTVDARRAARPPARPGPAHECTKPAGFSPPGRPRRGPARGAGG